MFALSFIKTHEALRNCGGRYRS